MTQPVINAIKTLLPTLDTSELSMVFASFNHPTQCWNGTSNNSIAIGTLMKNFKNNERIGVEKKLAVYCLRLLNRRLLPPRQNRSFEQRLAQPLSELESNADELGDRGDSLPTPVVSKAKLDNELSVYNSGDCQCPDPNCRVCRNGSDEPDEQKDKLMEKCDQLVENCEKMEKLFENMSLAVARLSDSRGTTLTSSGGHPFTGYS